MGGIAKHDEECIAASEYSLQDLTPAQGIFLMSLTALSSITVCVELYRLRGRARAHARGQGTSIAHTLEYLMFVQGAIDLVFHLLDFVFAIDCDASPLSHVLLDEPQLAIFESRTILWRIIKEGLGVCSVYWHSTTAYCIFAFVVLKHSVGRLRRRRLPFLVAFAVLLTGLRYLLMRTLRKHVLGLYLSAFGYDFLVIPAFLICMTRWNVSTAKLLYDKDRRHQQQQHEHELRQRQRAGTGEGGSSEDGSQYHHHRSSSLGRSTGVGGGGVGGGGSGGHHQHQHPRGSEQHDEEHEHAHASGLSSGSPSHRRSHSKRGSGSSSSSFVTRTTPRNRRIIRRLLRVSIVISSMWFTIVAVDASTWIHFAAWHRVAPRWALWMRAILMRLVGFIDALILGSVYRVLWRRCKACLATTLGACCCCCPSRGGDGAQGKEDGGGPPHPIRERLARALSSAMPIEGGGGVGAFLRHRLASSSPGGAAAAAAAALELASVAEGPGPEEEMARMIKAVEAINRARDVDRRLESSLVFATTWNCGGVEASVLEAGIGGVLPTWVPKGYDLYIFGVQECACLRELRRALHEYLGGPEAYAMLTREIGDDVILHGLIAITVFARASDVASGACFVRRGAVDKVASGVSLGPMGRAPNKGYVGMAIRYHDVSLAIITAHFASDKKGKNRVEKRNKDARRTLRELSLVWDTDGFDGHTQVHHAVILGDFNYRNMGGPAEVLKLVSQSAAECQENFQEGAAPAPASAASAAASTDTWRSHYAQFFELPRLLHEQQQQQLQHLQRLRQQQHQQQGADNGAAPAPPLLLPHTSTGRPVVSSYSSVASSAAAAAGVAYPLLFQGPTSLRELQEQSQAPTSLAAAAAAVNGGQVADLELGPNVSTLSSASVPAEPSAEAQAAGAALTPPPPAPSLGTGASASGVTTSIASGEGESSRQPSPPPSPRSSAGYTSLYRRYQQRHHRAWDWVPRYDELSVSMRRGLVFFGFEEGRISFPPSYRWNRSVHPPHAPAATDIEAGLVGSAHLYPLGLAGDFTSVDALAAAYSTAVADKPPSLLKSLTRSLSVASGASKPNNASARSGAGHPSSDSLVTGGGGGGGALEGTTARTPSYTDRILVHSLPARSPYLRWCLYETADCVQLSDHRPVCAALELRVDRDVRGGFAFPSHPHGHQHQRQRSHSLSHAEGGGPPASPATTLTAASSSPPRLRPAGPSTSVPRLLPSGPSGAAAASSSYLDGSVGGSGSGIGMSGSGGGGGTRGDLAAYSITMARPHYRAYHHQQAQQRPRQTRGSIAAGMGVVFKGPDPAYVTVVFPIVSEDPWAFERKASLLSEAMPGLVLPNDGASGGGGGGGGGGSRKVGFAGGRGVESTIVQEGMSSPLRQVRWKDFPVRLRVVASRRFAEHMLIKVTDAHRRDLGQAIVPIALALAQRTESSSSGSQVAATTDGGQEPGASPSLLAQETTVVGGGLGGPRHRFRFPLSSGGQFQGWLSLDLRVKARPLSSDEAAFSSPADAMSVSYVGGPQAMAAAAAASAAAGRGEGGGSEGKR